MTIEPMLAANAAVFAIKNATMEGKITVIVLLLLSLFSWTIILTKFRQLHDCARRDQEVFGRLRLDARPAGHPDAATRSLTARRRISFTSAARTNWPIIWKTGRWKSAANRDECRRARRTSIPICWRGTG